ncbi:hypothetical protein [Microbacterium aurum]
MKPDARFSADDLRADIDAFLCRMMDQSGMSRPISDYVREIETQCGLDSHWRYAQFYQQRFDGSRATVEAAVVDIFQSGAIWVDFSVNHFIEAGSRMPTTTEAALIAQGFADALLDRI